MAQAGLGKVVCGRGCFIISWGTVRSSSVAVKKVPLVDYYPSDTKKRKKRDRRSEVGRRRRYSAVNRGSNQKNATIEEKSKGHRYMDQRKPALSRRWGLGVLSLEAEELLACEKKESQIST